MKNLSVKWKITIWYTVIMALVSAVVLAVMTSVSAGFLDRDLKMRAEKATEMLAREVEKNPHIPGFRYFDQGVQMALLDKNFKIIGGQSPFGISDNLTCEEGNIRIETYHGKSFYVTDRKIQGETTYWVKGIVPVSDGADSMRSVTKSNALLILVMIILASGGGYVLLGRILAPVEKIRKTAEEISKSSDLSRRLSLPAGNDELHRLADSFDQMLDKLEDTLEREKQFSSDASHELRTPVAAILSSCEFMERYAKTEEDFKETAGGIKLEAERMSKLISQLLMISRMEQNTLKKKFERFDFGELLQFVCEEQQEIHTEPITLKTDIADKVFVRGDRELLIRLAVNLISNAYTYGKSRIFVSLKQEKEQAVLTVSDDGIGISEENLPKIWERFYQVNPSRTHEQGNMGLGLSMVRWIAAFHGGEIRVKSRLGEGTEFRFLISMQ